MQTLQVSLRNNPVYVTGTVNGVETVWTLVGADLWQTVADRAADDIYHVSLTMVTASGTSSQADFTLYYGILNLITDRTQADVDRVRYLSAKGWDGMTEEEKAEWRTSLKGAYNASDLNRVGAAVNYLAGRFTAYGYGVDVAPKLDWTVTDIPIRSSMDRYLSDVRELRDQFAVMQSTPPVPEDMEGLTYREANNIEQILVDLDFLLTNISAGWYYSGEVYSGEV